MIEFAGREKFRNGIAKHLEMTVATRKEAICYKVRNGSEGKKMKIPLDKVPCNAGVSYRRGTRTHMPHAHARTHARTLLQRTHTRAPTAL